MRGEEGRGRAVISKTRKEHEQGNRTAPAQQQTLHGKEHATRNTGNDAHTTHSTRHAAETGSNTGSKCVWVLLCSVRANVKRENDSREKEESQREHRRDMMREERSEGRERERQGKTERDREERERLLLSLLLCGLYKIYENKKYTMTTCFRLASSSPPLLPDQKKKHNT